MRKSAARNPQSDPNPTRSSLPSRRRIRFPLSSSRRSNPAAAAAAATPQLRWKFSDSDAAGTPRASGQGKAEAASARRLAAGIWHSELPVADVGPSKHRSPAVFPDPSTERATKWDAAKPSKPPSTTVDQSFDHLKNLIDQQMTQASSLESKLTAELDRARARIAKLESKRRSSSKQHADERAAWRLREQDKIQAVIDGMNGDLSAERKSRRRAEAMNAKLVDEIAEAKKAAKRYSSEYEKEKKARELLEEVCDQLAAEVGDDRAEAVESKRAREELEEERKMLQLAEVWREERVQMKLVDARLALEARCSQLAALQSELRSFLTSALDVEVIKEAELLVEAVADLVRVEPMDEFTYKPPPASEDIFAIFEELQHPEEPRDIGQCCSGTASPATDVFLGKPGSVEDDSEWETLSNSGSGEIRCGVDEEVRKSVSSISKLWPSCPVDMEQWSPPEVVNPHVARGMKGCIEWPRGGVHKQSLKTKLLEAKLDSHKVQIRHVLKQKI